TTITAIGGLLPMMFAVEINFWTREVTVGGPNELMWVGLSTAIVFGLAFSKMITLGLVPAMLALPYRRKEKRAGRAAARAATARGVRGWSGAEPKAQPAELSVCGNRRGARHAGRHIGV